jgi:hypothetical protein
MSLLRLSAASLCLCFFHLDLSLGPLSDGSFVDIFIPVVRK